MSSVSVLQAPGLGAVAAAKSPVAADTATPTTPSDSASAATNVPVPTAQLRASYPSPRVEVDPLTKQVVTEYRDAASGTATQQIPSKAQLRLYELNQSTGGATETPAVKGPVA